MTRVLIVGAGKGGRALLEMFVGDPTITIVGVADVNPWAPGLEIARRHDVPVTTDFRELLSPRVDLVIDVSGDRTVHRAIQETKAPGTEVMGGLGARFMWDLAAERKAKEELQGRYSLVVQQLKSHAEGDFILGQNTKMRETADEVARVAPTATAVLLRGEPGTGKELVARVIQRQSLLRDRPLLTINCTALAPAEIDAALFGPRAGGRPGAPGGAGLLERADGASLFFDELGDLPLDTQARLVHLLRAGAATCPRPHVSRARRVAASTGC